MVDPFGRSFVFIDILALFPRFRVRLTLSRRFRSGRGQGGSRTAPTGSGGVFHHRSFVFIDILALFRCFLVPPTFRPAGMG